MRLEKEKDKKIKSKNWRWGNGAILRQTERPQTKKKKERNTHRARAIPPLPRWLPLEASSVGPTQRPAALALQWVTHKHTF